MICPNCGMVMQDGKMVCPICGKPMKKGARIPGGVKSWYCPECRITQKELPCCEVEETKQQKMVGKLLQMKELNSIRLYFNKTEWVEVIKLPELVGGMFPAYFGFAFCISKEHKNLDWQVGDIWNVSDEVEAQERISEEKEREQKRERDEAEREKRREE